MSNLYKFIERFKKIAETTMDSYTRKHIYDAINLYDKEPKQLQKEEPKTYTQEEMDKAIEQAWIKGQQSMLEF